MAVQGSRRRLAQMVRRCIAVWTVQCGAGRDIGDAMGVQMIVLFGGGYVSTCWTVWREWVALKMGQKLTSSNDPSEK
jgi:hypothetical protein